jgi:two-component system sensor histidine kinase/response regulator
VLVNLIGNGLKFTSRGSVTLTVRPAEGAPGRLRFEVQDTGIGIPKDRIDRLFQSFSQVDASRSRKYGGTGLGLAISKQIVEAMGGSMFVKTEEGRGSIFGLRLQLSSNASASEGDGAPPPRSLRVLVADPSPTSATGLARLLQDGNHVETATEAAAARLLLLEAAKAEQPFDLVLTDLRLVEAFEALEDAGAKPLESTPMIVLAPVNQLSSAALAKWAGRKAALAKPVKRQDLYWCIHEVLRGPLPSQAARTEPAEELPLRGLHVLVAEDHPVNQRITSRFLQKLGIECEVVANGEEAIQALKQRDFDLVLMDVQMPVMDGLEATQLLRRREVGTERRVPVVAMTAHALPSDRERCIEAGMDDYLSKPIRRRDLLRVLREVGAWEGEVEEDAGEGVVPPAPPA